MPPRTRNPRAGARRLRDSAGIPHIQPNEPRMTRSHRAPERRPSATDTVLRVAGGAAIVVALTFAAEGCGRSAAAESAPPTPMVTLVTEDIATVERRDLATGPILTGTLTARRHATVRAEVGGAVTAVYADRGTE